MVNGRTVRPKIGIRNPYSQPGCREKTSWFNRMGFGYFFGHVLRACGFSIPHLCLLGSDGFGVPLLHTGLAVLFAFLANSKWFYHGLSPFAYLWDDIIGTLLYLPSAPWNLHFCLQGTIFWWCWCFVIAHSTWGVKSLVVSTSYGHTASIPLRHAHYKYALYTLTVYSS